MQNLRYRLTDRRVWLAVAIIAVLALLFLGANTLKMIGFLLAVIIVAALIVWLVLWLIKRAHAKRSSEQIGEVLTQPEPEPVGKKGRPANTADVEALREHMREAVKAIKTSRLGQSKGTQALYELPWYMIIGNPAAGKSTAILNSGLHFPLAEQHGKIVRGIGGTRNCDWYFTSNGIILDTAGRYSVETNNRSEWVSFLDMLRKQRPRAPTNGIIIAASIADLTGNRPEFTIELAKKLRNRVQELTEWLEVIAPVYVVFTKADLISGFRDFFDNLDENERNHVWGATLPFNVHAEGNVDLLTQFDRHFDELSDGLREMGLAHMGLAHNRQMGPGLLTLPLEFRAIKNTLRTFIATLFEDNPYQHKPVFRGFYFTSAVQEPASVHHASDNIASRFHLAPRADAPDTQPETTTSYFLHDLFSKVIFADKQLVRQYSSKTRVHRRYAVLLGSALALGLILAGWAWSYTNNRQLVDNAQADLAKAVSIQHGRIDLKSRLDALQILQDRLAQLQSYRHDHPVMLGLGLYQGGAIEKKIRHEYFHGMHQVMLDPVTQNMEAYLAKVDADSAQLSVPTPGKAPTHKPRTNAGLYQAPSPTNSQDAYNALRAYLMLAHPRRVEPVQLSAELTRFWRGWLQANRGMMTRGQLISRAQSVMTFYVSEFMQPDWPTIDARVTLVHDTRGALRNVMSGMSAIHRVYGQIKARAATRFAPVTVASILGTPQNASPLLAGSYAVPGIFTREAWNGYVKDAIKDAANHELNTTDWVLQTQQSTDLTLSGSPEQLQKQLETMYDKDYTAQWHKFMSGVTVNAFPNFLAAENGVNRLADPTRSPLQKLLTKIYDETSWDNPSTVGQGLKTAKGGFVAWFKRVVLREAPSDMQEGLEQVNVPVGKSGSPATLKYGAVGRSFTGIAQLVIAQDGSPSLLGNYLGMLGKLGTRLNVIKTQGSTGPGARELMAETLAGNQKSELSNGLQLVDKDMLDGLDARQRQTLRPLLLHPLMQTFKALIVPTERDINKTWAAQVYTPFQNTLAGKYPFDSTGQVQAVSSEIAQIFGPRGAISQFASKTLAPLVIQRGNTLIARQWAGMGITLSTTMLSDFPQWVAPVGQTATTAHQSVFKVYPHPGTGGIIQYTLDINGKKLRYENTPPTWVPFVWSTGDNSSLTAKITAQTYDGRTLVLENFSGPQALAKLFQAADPATLDHNTKTYTLTWANHGKSVTVNLRIVSSPGVNANGTQRQGLLGMTLPTTVAGTASATSHQLADRSHP